MLLYCLKCKKNKKTKKTKKKTENVDPKASKLVMAEQCYNQNKLYAVVKNQNQSDY